MNISIQEQNFTLRSEYDISSPSFTYYAEKKLLSLPSKLQLLGEDRQILARIQGRFSLLLTKYDFLFPDGKIYRFWCEKVWKGVFTCEGNGEKLQLYRHRWLNYSIFQNDHQIAAFTKNHVVIGRGNQYDLRINEDANVLVAICMVLALNTSEDDDEHSTVTYDMGNIGPEDRPFDKSWEPS